MITISNQRDVLMMLADETLRLSIWEGKAQIIKRDTGVPVARVQNGLAGKLVDKGLLAYDGLYELTETGKQRCAEKGKLRL